MRTEKSSLELASDSCPWPLTREQFQLEFGVEGRLRWGRCESRFHILEAGQGKDRGSGELIT